MNESRFHTLIESITNTIFGFVLSYAASFIIMPLAGLPVNGASNLIVVGLFTLLSVIRNYINRRLFIRGRIWWNRN